MSYPPPPHDPNSPGPPGSGGGFGPPQGFGPPEQPGGYGYPGQGGYGYPGQGGYPPGGPPPQGPYPPPPPPPGGGSGAKIAAIAIAAVLAGVLIVGGVLVFASKGDGGDGADQAGTTPTRTPDTAQETQDTGTSDSRPTPEFSIPSDYPSASTETTPQEVPYVVLDPGQCFDHPSLSSEVSVVTRRSCNGPHNGEVISNQRLSGTYSTPQELQGRVLQLCKTDATRRLQTMPNDGTTYYYYAIYPALETYQQGNGDTISCSLTLSNELDGPKLTGPLPG